MPELRKDPIVGRWVIIATERARRPGSFIDTKEATSHAAEETCPFCHGNISPLFTLNREKQKHAAWDISVIPFKNSYFKMNTPCVRETHGLYNVVNGFGTHEVVVETPRHIANMADLELDQIALVFETYRHRLAELEKNPQFRFAIAYKNYKTSAGGRNIAHARSHIIATPVNPLRIKEKLRGAKEYFERNHACVYCDLIKNEIKEKKRVIHENKHFIALSPFASRFLFEVLILPKKHHCDFAKGVAGQEWDLAKILKDILLRFKVGLDDPSYNYVLQTAPFRRPNQKGRFKTIEQDYHWHIELIPRLTRAAGFEKGSGFYICPIPPELTAEFLREVEVEKGVPAWAS